MDITYFVDYSDDDSDDYDEPQPKRRRTGGVYRKWKLKKTYKTAEEAEEAVNSCKFWKKCSSTNTSSGSRVTYRCSKGEYRGEECPAGLYLLYDAKSLEVLLYETDNEHVHHNNTSAHGLTTQQKEFIKKKFQDGITKPNSILDRFREEGIPEPPKSKLINHLKTVREEKYGSPTMSANEIREWCENQKNVPDDLDTAFVLSYHVYAESNVVEEQDLKIVISTKRLLSIAKKSSLLQTDGTYKLVWQGYPVLLAGTSDQNNKFHPYALAVVKSESIEDYSFIFRAIQEYVSNWQPTVLLADGSDAITSAFSLVFEVPFIRLMCYFHVVQNNEKFLKVLTKDGISAQLKMDISVLQHCVDEATFTKATELFLNKWKAHKNPRVKEFIHHFKDQWILKYPNWYEGAAKNYPSTNNSLEATNAWIKRSHTLREILPVGQFVNGIVTLIESWSKRRDPSSTNCENFADTPTRTLQQWTAAYQWTLEKRSMLQQPHSTIGWTQYSVPSHTLQKDLTPKLLKQHLKTEGKWKTFDAFKTHRYSIWHVVVNPECVNQSTCSCPIFLKFRECKHRLGVLIRLKMVDVPPAAKNVSLGQKRKRGRPSLAKKALMTQNT